jgi:hypothetical protein
VLETLAPVPKDRKCFRLINGVLVERTVADVMPALQTNAEGLKSVLEGLVKEYKKKQQEMETWKVCGRLVPVSPPPSSPSFVCSASRLRLCRRLFILHRSCRDFIIPLLTADILLPRPKTTSK